MADFFKFVRLINKQEQLNLDKVLCVVLLEKKSFVSYHWELFNVCLSACVPDLITLVTAQSSVNFFFFCCYYGIVKNSKGAHNKWTFLQYSFIFPFSVLSPLLQPLPKCLFPTSYNDPKILERFFIFNQLCTHHIVVVIIILWYLQRHECFFSFFSCLLSFFFGAR